MQWENDLVDGSDRFFSALGRAYWTDADPRGFAEGSVALVRREEKYAKGHLEGWYGIINNYETELMMKCTNQITSQDALALHSERSGT